MNFKFIRYMLARVLQLEAAFLALPLLCTLIYREPAINVRAFVLTILLVLLASLFLGRNSSKDERIYEREGIVIVALSWILMSAFGSLPFMLSGQIPHVVDAFFETVSGFTTTGSTILVDVEALSHSMLFWRSFTHLIGGMGILVFALAVLPMMGGSLRMMRAEVPGPEVGKIVSRMSLSARILYIMYISMTAVLVIFLLFGGMNLFDALIHAFGTAGTGGFSNYNASVAHFNSLYIEMVLGVGMLLFGVNFTLYYFLISGHWREIFKNEELRWYLSIMGLATLAMTLNNLSRCVSWGESLRHSFFTASSLMTSTGYVSVDFGLWPLFSHLIFMSLMIIGASSGSTGGGFKVMRVRTVVIGAVLEVFQVREPKRVLGMRQGDRQMDSHVWKRILNYLGLYLLFIVGLTFLMSLEQEDLLSSLSAVLTTFNNIGPGLGIYGPTENFSAMSYWAKGLLSFSMLAGRLEIFPILILFTPMTWKRTL